MEYPIFNLSLGACDEFIFPELFFHDPVFFDNKDLSTYKLYYHDKEYVDVNGKVYRSVGVTEVSSWLRKKAKLKRKYHIKFEPTNRILTFNEIKEKYLDCLTGFKSDEAKAKFIHHANQSKSIKELL